MLQIKNLDKSFGNHEIFQGLNFKVKKGQVYGLIGPNGIGKTTLMKMILGWDTDFHGEILKEPGSSIGYSPENPDFPSILTGSQVLEYYMEVRGYPKKSRKKESADLMKLVQLAPDNKTLVCQYSKGMKQRLGLAQAMIGNPDILLLDEPSAGLDFFGQKMIQKLIQKLKGQGRSILLNSHLLADVNEVIDGGIILMGPGKARTFEKEEIKEKPLSQIFIDFAKEVNYEGLN